MKQGLKMSINVTIWKGPWDIEFITNTVSSGIKTVASQDIRHLPSNITAEMVARPALFSNTNRKVKKH